MKDALVINSTINDAEKQINELENRMIEIIAMKENKGKKKIIKRNTNLNCLLVLKHLAQN